MTRIFILQMIFLATAVFGLGSCYDDKGNYDYKELTSLQIDTTGIKSEQTAYQFENFKVPVDVKYAGEAKNLSYEWKIYPQEPKKDDDVLKYDSAVVLYTKPVFDTVIYEVPGKYYLSLTVTDHSQDIKEYYVMKLNVETMLSRGLCVMDEKNGIYDLHMIKAAKLLPEILAAEEQTYYHVYSGVNEMEVTNGKFLGFVSVSSFTTNRALYFFTETGGIQLDLNTFAMLSNDYTSWFSFPMSITAAPEAFSVTSRPMEVIVNNGLVYVWDHLSMSETSFGDRLAGDYQAAPFLLKMTTNTFATVIFDVKNKRFAPIDIFGSNVGRFESTAGAEFDLNDIGASKELVFMENGFNAYTYAVFYDTGATDYSLYVMDFAGETPSPIKKYAMSGCTGLNLDSRFAFSNQGNVCFYSSGSDLCQYKYASTNAGSSVHSFTGETITGIKMFRNSGHAKDGKLLIVSTQTGTGDGKIYLLEFNELTGVITSGLDKPYTGFGKIIDTVFKE